MERAVERGRLRGIRANRRIRRLLVDDVVLRPPAAHVVREDHVRRELIAQRHPALRERGAEVDRTCLLEVAPQVGLDVDDDRLRPLDASEEQAHVVPVRGHRRRVTQVGEVGVRLVASTRLRLQQHVVRQHRNLAVLPGLVDVHRGERAVRVPGRPALTRVHAAGEVLVAEAERSSASKRSGSTGRVADAELQRVRPRLRERRQRRRRCTGRSGADERGDQPDS